MKLEDIWSQYRISLKAFLRTKIANPDDVDDLLQEILIKTHANIGRIKKVDSIKPWLFQVANRTVIDFYRKNSRGSDISTTDLWYGDSDSDVREELSACIEPFIQALPEDAAKLLLSVDIEGKSQKQLADELQISYSTLKSRVQKSRIKLKALFDTCCNYRLDKAGNLIDFEQKTNTCKNC